MLDVEQAWDRIRHRVGRALGPLTASRHGWGYVARRTGVTWVARALAGRPRRARTENVAFGDLPARFPDVAVHPVIGEEHHPGVELREPASAWSRTRPLAAPWTVPAQAVLEIPDGIVFGSSGWVGVDEHHVLAEGAMARGAEPPERNRREADRGAHGDLVHLPGRTATLVQALVRNYSHALGLGLPAIDLLDRGIGLDRVDRFLVRSTLGAHGLELLDRCGIAADRIVFVPDAAPIRYRCDMLIATTYSKKPDPGFHAVVEPLRRRFAPELERAARDPAPRARWYLTRRALSSRRVVNESAVVAMLERRGFEPLVMDGRTVAEQAVLVARSECLVCVHGAAMTNIVFAAPGTPVIELMPRNWVVWSFARLATVHGLPYDVVAGVEPALSGRLHTGLMDADLVVDVDELAGRVDAVLS